MGGGGGIMSTYKKISRGNFVCGDIVRIPHRQPAQTAIFILDKDDKNAKQIKKLIDRRAQTPKYSIENKIMLVSGAKKEKQEMSQSCDECPQRNWSSIRHILGKLAVI